MRVIRNDLPETLGRLEIELLFDIHIGSPKCDYKLLHEKIEQIKNNEHVYCIIGGDILNNSTKTSVGDVYSEPLSPMQQIEQAVKLFTPIKDKILAVTSGNHERRSYKQDGLDLVLFMCNELGITDRYDYVGCLNFIRFGCERHRSNNNKSCHSGRKLLYTIYTTHGDGNGGRTTGGKANGLERRGQIINSDIVITGHTHQPFVFRQKAFKIVSNNSNYVEFEQTFVNAGSFLNYESYAELYGLRPSSKQSPVIILDGTQKQVIVSL